MKLSPRFKSKISFILTAENVQCGLQTRTDQIMQQVLQQTVAEWLMGMLTV